MQEDKSTQNDAIPVFSPMPHFSLVTMSFPIQKNLNKNQSVTPKQLKLTVCNFGAWPVACSTVRKDREKAGLPEWRPPQLSFLTSEHLLSTGHPSPLLLDYWGQRNQHTKRTMWTERETEHKVEKSIEWHAKKNPSQAQKSLPPLDYCGQFTKDQATILCLSWDSFWLNNFTIMQNSNKTYKKLPQANWLPTTFTLIHEKRSLTIGCVDEHQDCQMELLEIILYYWNISFRVISTKNNQIWVI